MIKICSGLLFIAALILGISSFAHAQEGLKAVDPKGIAPAVTCEQVTSSILSQLAALQAKDKTFKVYDTIDGADAAKFSGKEGITRIQAFRFDDEDTLFVLVFKGPCLQNISAPLEIEVKAWDARKLQALGPKI